VFYYLPIPECLVGSIERQLKLLTAFFEQSLSLLKGDWL